MDLGFKTNWSIVWVIMVRRRVSSEHRRSSCSSLTNDIYVSLSVHSLIQVQFQFNFFQLKKKFLEMNIGHSFKYTITNMIVAWGQPFVIFPSCFFCRLKTCWLRRHRNKEINSGDISQGLSHQSFELFNAKQNIPFILNETKGARSSNRAYVPQICLSLFCHNTYDGVHKTKQNVLTTTSDHLWLLVIHRLLILVPQELSKRIYLNYHKCSFGERLKLNEWWCHLTAHLNMKVVIDSQHCHQF